VLARLLFAVSLHEGVHQLQGWQIYRPRWADCVYQLHGWTVVLHSKSPCSFVGIAFRTRTKYTLAFSNVVAVLFPCHSLPPRAPHARPDHTTHLADPHASTATVATFPQSLALRAVQLALLGSTVSLKEDSLRAFGAIREPTQTGPHHWGALIVLLERCAFDPFLNKFLLFYRSLKHFMMLLLMG